MKKTVIGFVGGARHGKDTAAELVRSVGRKDVYPWRLGFADLLKKQASILGWDGEKDEPGRDLLIELSWPVKKYGNWLAQKYPYKYGDYAGDNYYTANLYKTIKNEPYEIFCLSDLRFRCEYDFLRKKAEEGDIDFFIVRVCRVNDNNEYYAGNLTESQLNSASENEWKDFPAQFVVLNNSTLDNFKKHIDEVFREILRLTERE